MDMNLYSQYLSALQIFFTKKEDPAMFPPIDDDVLEEAA
jgi:hypothetical protein